MARFPRKRNIMLELEVLCNGLNPLKSETRAVTTQQKGYSVVLKSEIKISHRKDVDRAVSCIATLTSTS